MILGMSFVTYSAVFPDDIVWMRQALALAEKGLFTTTPNPRVGAVIVNNGHKVGQGFHERAGESHAEVIALQQAQELSRGATLYVTLEPCSHYDRTPPCVDSVIKAGIQRVVIAMQDPNPLVSGQGIAKLKEQGITVCVGVEEDLARELNIGFISRMERQRPWIRAKVAMSMDAVTALSSGESQWITHDAARMDGHSWRARSCAMLTGAGTVRVDNPRLTVRSIESSRQPLRIVIDNQLDTDPDAHIYDDGHAVILTVNPAIERAAQYEKRGVRVRCLEAGENGRVAMESVTKALHSLQLNEVLLETGQRLNGVFLEAGLIDEWICYVAPTFLGIGGSGVAQFGPLAHLSQRTDFTIVDVKHIAEDLRIVLRAPESIKWLNRK